jgi:AraC family transcriptional regulator
MKTVQENYCDEYARRINRVLDHIEVHLGEELRLEDLAAVACFSPFHFHRLFKAFCGETIGEHLRRRRLERAARQLICERAKPVTAIALDCGFSSSQNFAKAFRLHFGLSPSEVRRRHDWRDPHFHQNSKPGNTRRKLGKDLLELAGYPEATDDEFIRIDCSGGDDMQVRIIEMEPLRVAYFRGIGTYSPATIGPLFQKLMAWAGPRGICGPASQIMGVCWDDPGITPEPRCRYDACITVAPDFQDDGRVSLQLLPGGRYAVRHCEFVCQGFEKAWEELMTDWLPTSGYQPDDRPNLEFYYNDGNRDPENKWIMDIWLPVKPL